MKEPLPGAFESSSTDELEMVQSLQGDSGSYSEPIETIDPTPERQSTETRELGGPGPGSAIDANALVLWTIFIEQPKCAGLTA
jgi:hypothetical protein